SAFNRESSTGFEIAEITIRHQPADSGTWTHIATKDLRGLSFAGAGAGVSALDEEFADNLFRVFDESDITKEMAFDVGTLISIGNTRTYQTPDHDGIINISGANFDQGVFDIALDSISSSDSGAIDVLLGTDAGDDFIVGNNDAFIVEGDNDRVGIGLSNPTFPLHVASAENDVAFFQSVPTNSVGTLLTIKSLGSSSTGNASLILSNNAGNNLQIVSIRSGLGGHSLIKQIDGNDLSIATGSFTPLFLQGSDGFVGIQDTAPGTLLQLKIDGDPYITLQNATDENTDGGAESRIIFEDHANVALAQIQGSHDGASKDTKGDLIFYTHTGSALAEAMRIDSAQLVTLADGLALVTDKKITFRDSGQSIASLNVDALSIEAKANITSKIDGSVEITYIADRMTLNNGISDTAIGWPTSGQM
ncbi:hypothetical protein LCGC14_2761500, partial [marine sediment metagenome]